MMPIYARRPKSNFTPAPEGLHAAVCVDVWEPWTEERREDWGGGLVDKTRIVWLLEEINNNTGKPYEVSQLYTLSLHPKSKMSGHLESWRGRPFTDEERKGFDVERLIGVSCQLQVVHRPGNEGQVYSNVQTIVPLGKGMAKLRVPEDYVRRKDRVRDSAEPESGETPTDDDSDAVPF